MALKEIQAGKDGKLKVFAGSQARIVHDADGKVLVNKKASTRPTMTIAPAKHTVKIGTDKEIADEKVAQDAKFKLKDINK